MSTLSTGLTATDMFCGAGGSSIGAAFAGVNLRLGLNHWSRAIETHAANFPNAEHDCEDIASLTTAQIRRYPDSDILLASPECTNHSLSKGARRRKPVVASLFDDGPAGDAEQDRSRATMWDVVRFCEQKLIKGKPYKAVIVENVVEAYRWGWNDDGGLFGSWLSAMTALGYRYEIVWLNSMFCWPTPQSRDRMYVVFWRRGMRSPNLRIEPKSWCPSCKRIVEGRQTWKRIDRPLWGRYGAQYFYTCPDCRGTVIPAVFPAAAIIDDSLPAPVIGGRARPLAANTRERIRRGLERLAREPFALRVKRGKSPHPLTLPVVSASSGDHRSMMIPVSGNTHESSPGNRAKESGRDPLATILGTLNRALVYANRANGVPRPAVENPAQSVCTGGHLAVIMANYSPGWSRRADEHPTGSITTQDGHSLVVPYMGKTRASFADREPVATIPTRDRLSLVVPPPASEVRPDPVSITDSDIDECRFRMFNLREIAGAMAMVTHVTGDEYAVLGNKRERMAQFGNAVTPPAMRLLVERLIPIFDEVKA